MGQTNPIPTSARRRPPYPERFGLDEVERDKLLRLAELSSDDHALVHSLQRDVIAPDAQRIVSEFYLRMQQQPDFQELLATNASRAETLKSAYRRYLLSFGVGFDSDEYFQERLHIGAVHAMVGVPLSFYLTACRFLEQLIVMRVLASEGDEAHRRALLGVVLKVMALDTALVSETYHGSHVGALRDSVEALRSRGEKLMRDLSTDSLTRVASRRSVLQVLDGALRTACSERRPVGIILLDIDHFKRINDRYGHITGDTVLQVTAARIRSSLRPADEVGRYGGEEFLIVLPGADEATGRQVASRIRQSLSRDLVQANGAAIPVTASQGIAVSDGSEECTTVIERADAALYAAKHAGRDRIRS
jgi:diguanylate cyclase (GGDEF)-like protein